MWMKVLEYPSTPERSEIDWALKPIYQSSPFTIPRITLDFVTQHL